MDRAIMGYQAEVEWAPRPVQLAIELSPTLIRRLSSWCREAALDLDVPRLARGEVLEALLDHLVVDEAAGAAVRDRLAVRLGH